jgi:competence protein ComEA
MFYFSRGEQAGLLLLVVFLLAGAGVLTYARGRHSRDATTSQPLLVPAPAQTSASQRAGRQAGSPAQVEQPYVAVPGGAPRGALDRQASGAPAPPRTGANRPERAVDRISLNTASQKELEALPGIGPVLAQRIIAYREQRKREGHRGFESKDELLNVPGIGPKRYTAVRDLVSL